MKNKKIDPCEFCEEIDCDGCDIERQDELLSVKAAMSDANYSGSIGAQAFFHPIQDNTTHPPRTAVRQNQSIVAAVGTKTFLYPITHSPLAAAYSSSISTRARDKPKSFNTKQYPIQSKRGDMVRSGGISNNNESRRFFPKAFFPLAFPPTGAIE